jgi:hypothetical protein
MKMKNKFFASLMILSQLFQGLALPALGAVTEPDKAIIGTADQYIGNGGFESGTAGWKLYSESDVVTFTDAGDTVNLTAHNLQNGQQVAFTSITSTTGISVDTLYFVVGATTNTFQVSATSGGSALPLTTNGSGTMVRDRPKTGAQGGSPTVSFNTTVGAPLQGNVSGIFVHNVGADRMGQGWQYEFSIKSGQLGKTLNVGMLQTLNSGTYDVGSDTTNPDITAWVYGPTDGTPSLIQLAPYKVLGCTSGTVCNFQASFQTANTGLNYRLIFHESKPSTVAYQLKVDGITVSPVQKSLGTVITDWQSYTPTFTGFTSPTAIAFYSRRVGDTLEVQGTFGTGTVTGATASVTLGYAGGNSNVTIDSTKISTAVVGSAVDATASATIFSWSVIATGGASNLNFGIQTSSTASLTVATGSAIAQSGTTFQFFASVPILGWSSGTVMSSNADGRVVSLAVNKSTIQSIPNNSITQVTGWDTPIFDTLGAFNATTGVYTVPTAGKYRVTSMLTFETNSTGERLAAIFKNGNLLQYGMTGTAITGDSTSSQAIAISDCVAGDTITVEGYQTSGGALNLRALGQATSFYIDKITGSSSISATDTVAARYSTSAGQSIPNNVDTVVNFDTKEFDKTGSVTTGAAWKFTAPVPGVYNISAHVMYTNQSWTSGNVFPFTLIKNGSTGYALDYKEILATTSSYMTVSGSMDLYLVAGDFIQITSLQNSGASRTFEPSGSHNWVSIHRVGN